MPKRTPLRIHMLRHDISPRDLAARLAALDPPFIADDGHLRNVRDGHKRAGVDLAKAIERAIGNLPPGLLASDILYGEPLEATATADPKPTAA